MNVAAILKEKGRDVVTSRPDVTLLDIAKQLSERRIGCIVLVGDDGEIAGIVSERDIVRVMARDGIDSLQTPISQTMTKDVVTCGEADTIDYLMSEMTVRRTRHIPVLESGSIAGLVSIGDVVKHRIAEAEMEAEAMRAYIATG
jgi:CBS domain-containing protein